MCRLKIIQICRVQSTEALPVSFESKLFFALIKRISLSTGDIKLAKKYIYSTPSKCFKSARDATQQGNWFSGCTDNLQFRIYGACNLTKKAVIKK